MSSLVELPSSSASLKKLKQQQLLAKILDKLNQRKDQETGHDAPKI